MKDKYPASHIIVRDAEKAVEEAAREVAEINNEL